MDNKEELLKQEELKKRFLSQNQELNLHWTPKLYHLFSTFAKKALHALNDNTEWNLSVLELQDSIWKIKDRNQRSSLLEELNSLVSKSLTPIGNIQLESTPLVYTISYRLISDLIEKVPSVAKSEREKLGLAYRAFSAPSRDQEVDAGISRSGSTL